MVSADTRAEVIARLEFAKRLVEPPVPQAARFALVRFTDDVRASNLEAAWDSLAEVGRDVDVPKAFWQALAEAASLLGLEERRAEALRQT